MNKMKSMLLMASMMTSLTYDDSGIPINHHRPKKKSKETEEELKQRLTKAEAQINKAKGLTEFFYGEKSLWALNQKSADKKAKKKNW